MILVGTAMKRHAQRKHNWGTFLCHRCKFLGYYPGDLARHILEAHPGIEGGAAAKCPTCTQEVPFGNKVETLEEHYKYVFRVL
jgi:hypothetical protein